MNYKRLWCLCCIGILLPTLVGAYLYFWHSRPIGKGAAGPTVPSFRSTTSELKAVWLVGIGDSVTAGFGARHGYSYFDRLVINPPDEFPDMAGKCPRTWMPKLQWTNLAVSGSTSGEHLARQIPRLPLAVSNSLAFVVITTGGNDLIHNYGRTPAREEAMFGATWAEAGPWVTNFEARLDTMVTQVKAHFPGDCHILLANIFDPTDELGDASRAGLPEWPDGMKILAAYNDVIRRCSERYPFVHLVDVHSAFLGHGIHCTQVWSPHYDSKDPHYWYFVNLEDPNERGYDVIRRLFLIEMQRVLTQSR
jgi:lysophospholipase L1-like esterase